MRSFSVVVASLIAACGAEAAAISVPKEDPLDGFAAACDGNSIGSGDGFTPNVPVDWVGVRTESARFDEPDSLIVTRGPERGLPCAGADDSAACLEAVEAIRLLPECGAMDDCTLTYLVYTRGDEVGAASTNEELGRFLFPVDTKEEAYFFAQRVNRRRFLPSCEGDPQPKFRIDPNGGVDVTFVAPRQCPEGTLDEVIVHVAEDGRVTERMQIPLTTTRPCDFDAH